MGRNGVKDESLRKFSFTYSMTKNQQEQLKALAKAGKETIGDFLVRKHKLKNEPVKPEEKKEE